jgi:hypothetical protein
VKKFIDIILPDKTERVQVVITSVNDDGSYNYKGDVYGGFGTYQPLYDESGNVIQPSVDQQAGAMAPDMIEALQILLGGE